MWKFLISINKKLVWAIPVMMVVGYFFGTNVDQVTVKSLKQLIVPFTFLMVYPMMVTLNIKHLLDGIKNVKLQLLAQVINFCLIPFLAYALGLYFFPDNHYMALGLLLASLLPTSGMTISWTGFAKGNMGAAINMTVIGLTLGSIATPFYVQALMGAKVDMDVVLVIKQIVYIVFIPMALGYVTRTTIVKRVGLPEFKKTWAPRFPSLSTIGVLGIVFVAIALKAEQLSQNPAILWKIFQPLLIIYVLNYGLSTILGRILFKRGDAIALVYGTVMRNLSIALAISINAFGDKGADAALVIAVAYIVQVQSAAWYVKLTNALFGPPEQGKA
ncbi:MAG: arsenic resistance protein [Desulfobulbaceae bacterium]|uniref:Arsenic resistance protein n=1 Tax=Candidatus Desulfatifera sulfidica TaxID=2841691 RepID=A0A8J6TD52_9BACT|nr:arsenic resistance protein [Candidatus Desulfatifera sulfidica]